MEHIGMKLYHYSDNRLRTIKTKGAQGRVSKLEMKEADKIAGFMEEVGPYYKHLSFFFDPIPRNIAEIFGKGHNFWFEGNVIYEHVVDANDLIPFKWHLMEMSETIQLADTMKWGEGVSREQRRLQIRELNRHDKAKGYVGETLESLEDAIEELDVVTAEAFIAERKRDKNRESFQQYAAGVPHLMIYPDDGMVKPISIKEITL